jgi:hypothetical protein
MFQSGVTYQETITMITETCCNCGVAFGIPSDLHRRLQNDPDKWFYCPNGHRQHYLKSREKTLREDAERRLREKEEELIRAANNRLKLEKELKKSNNKLKRVSKGVCPCCNRTFQNLANHMKTEHSDLIKNKPCSPAKNK